MAYWLELHCDTTLDEVDGVRVNDPDVPKCHSHMHNFPMGFVNSISEIHKVARDMGWKKIDGIGWCCPWCSRYSAEILMQKKI